MVIGFIGFALVAGIGLYLRFRYFDQSYAWRTYHRICSAERLNTQLPLPRRQPAVWDYEHGIPYWNPALMIASGFDPRTYRPQPGDSELV